MREEQHDTNSTYKILLNWLAMKLCGVIPSSFKDTLVKTVISGGVVE